MAPTAAPRSHATPGAHYEPAASLEAAIKRAAHVLPSQGPIAVFVHHNTLHAFEDMPFEQAVERGLEVYGQQPYLSEERYRQELGRGRIRHEDVSAVLVDDLGDEGDALIGLLGTRFHLRLAMLSHSLYTASSAELNWVVAETDAARTFRPDVSAERRQRVIQSTRRWVMREFPSGADRKSPAGASPAIVAILQELFESFEKTSIEQWSERTWEAFTLQLLWRLCSEGVRTTNLPNGARAPRRHRDILLDAVGEDTDELVNDVLIRFTAAYLDQGFAHWALPDRKRGFYQAFLRLYGAPGKVAPKWLHGLREEAERLGEEKIKPLQSIKESLEELGVAVEEREEFITATLLALSGWTGMIWQLETNADWAVRPAAHGTLVEFLAVRLLLERFALAHVAARHMNYRGELKGIREAAFRRQSYSVEETRAQRAFLLFQLAQVLGMSPEDLHALPAKNWVQVITEIEAFSELERRRIFHLAYERRYREETLAAIAAHAGQGKLSGQAVAEKPSFQIICCIDEREESFRRHLEEAEPSCETFGYAGFFGVAMYYRGVADAHARPLCPVVIKPKHYVEELPVFSFEQTHLRRAGARRIIGTASHYFHRGSRSLLGGALTAIFGSVASFPLVARILFPRTASHVRRLFGQFVRSPEITHLLLERTEPTPGPEDGHVGYTVDEMADIVERTLRDNGLTANFAPLVIMCGHGSSSLNNPHESAYNCGACSGGRGGPNARAFAQMANDSRVRAILATRGVNLPHETFFIGAFHNTCNDGVTYFELDRLPPNHKNVFARARRAIDEARQRNAHERCRRFESASLAITPKAALAHVEGRSEDLSQARPEYNHATNAVTFVGRRATTRGLYMDRRCFLASYDPAQDDDQGTILARILAAVIPVCAGISLEYYFSCVDPQGYGCGSKLPHNIVSLLGVMEGALSDLRPGLSAQMVEIHEPMRELFIIETKPAIMKRIIDANPVIGQLCDNEWVHVVALDPADNGMHIYRDQSFQPYTPPSIKLPQVESSQAWYRGWRDNLGYAEINKVAEARAVS